MKFLLLSKRQGLLSEEGESWTSSMSNAKQISRVDILDYKNKHPDSLVLHLERYEYSSRDQLESIISDELSLKQSRKTECLVSDIFGQPIEFYSKDQWKVNSSLQRKDEAIIEVMKKIQLLDNESFPEYCNKLISGKIFHHTENKYFRVIKI